MRYRVADLEGALLDAAVAKAEGKEYGFSAMRGDPATKRCLIENTRAAYGDRPDWFAPSTDWQCGGPIIERERIEISPCRDYWIAAPDVPPIDLPDGDHKHLSLSGPTPLIAAMRAFCAARFGEEIEL